MVKVGLVLTIIEQNFICERRLGIGLMNSCLLILSTKKAIGTAATVDYNLMHEVLWPPEVD